MTDNIIKKLIKSKSGLRIVTEKEEQRSPFIIQEPQWVPDKEATNCTNCSVKFGFTTRKHHCRRCGQIFCNLCCEKKVELPRMCFVDPVRICLTCESSTHRENKFFQKDLKLLTSGAIFLFRSLKNVNTNQDQLMRCKLSLNHRYLLFDGVEIIEPLDLNHILSLKVHCDKISGSNSILDLEFSQNGISKLVTLAAAIDGPEKKIGINWISAFQEAYNMLDKFSEDQPVM
ncbi:zinc finger FYVE domain-containing protein 21-like [Rhodnius prolixus]